MVPEKRCTKCGETKNLEEFRKDSRRPDGRGSTCKHCSSALTKEYRNRNSDQVRAKDRQRGRDFRERNPGYLAAYREKNLDVIRQQKRRYYVANAEIIRSRVRMWYAENPERAYANQAKRRARLANAPHEPYSRTDVFARYVSTCAYCDAPAEHIDHVVPISKGGADAAHNLLPACAPCNLAKSDKSLAEWAATF